VGTVWDKNTDDVKAIANGVTESSAGQAVLTLSNEVIPTWATYTGAMPTFTINITYKQPIDAAHIQLNDKEITYGDTQYSAVDSVAMIGGNYGDITSTIVTFTDANGITTTTQPTKAGIYKMVATVSNANYSGTSAEATLTINPKSVTVSGITAEDKTYDGYDTATLVYTGAVFDGKLDSDTLTVNATGKFDGKNIGADKTVNITNIALGGADAANYVLTATTATTTAKITTKTVTISANGVTITKEYDGTNAPGEINGDFTVTGIVTGDDAVLSVGTVPVYDSKAVGSYTVAVPVSLTGEDAANYEMVETVDVTATITKATINSIATPAPSHSLTAADNKTAVELKNMANSGSALPPTVVVLYGNGPVDELPITWADAAEQFNPKGGTYTYVGTLTVGENFNDTDMTLTATVTVAPVKASVADNLTDATYSKAQIENMSALTELLPATMSVTYTYAGGAETTGNLEELVWNKTLAEIKAEAANVTSTSNKTVTVTLSEESFPAWATIECVMPSVTFTITNKHVIPETDITFNDQTIIFGDTYDPVSWVTVADKSQYAGATKTVTFSGVEGYPTDAGTYTMTVTVDNANYLGTKSAKLTIAPKSLADATVALAGNSSEFTYTGAAITPDVTIQVDGITLVQGRDFTVTYVGDNENVGTGAVTVSVAGIGNYKDTAVAQPTFNIIPAEINNSNIVVSGITGNPKVGDTVSVTLNVPKFQIGDFIWTWKLDDEQVDGDSNVYTLDADASGSELELTIKAIVGKNYTGSASKTFCVEKMTVTGSVTIDVESDNDYIDVGDVLRANVDSVDPVQAQRGGSYQWYHDGEEIDGADTSVYVVTEDTVGVKLHVEFTPDLDKFQETTLVSAPVVIGMIPLNGTLIIAGDPAVGEVLTAEFDTSAPADAYEIIWYCGDVEIGNGDTYVVDVADQGTSIYAKVIAVGDYSGEYASAAIVIPADAPDAPVLTAQAGNGQVVLTWEPGYHNGSAILGYIVYVNGEKLVDLAADVTTYTVTGLTNGTTYQFQVVAKNGVGETSDSATATPKAPYVEPDYDYDDDDDYTGGTTTGPVVKPGTSTGTTTGGSDSDISASGSKVEVEVSTEKEKDGSYSAAITEKDGDKLVESAADENASSVVITPDVSKNADSVSVTIPATTVSGLADETNAAVVVETPVANVILSNDTLAGLDADEDVTVAVEENKQGQIEITVAVDGEAQDEIDGGLTAVVPVAKSAGVGIVAVEVNPDGTETIIPKSMVKDGELTVALDGSAVIELRDNSQSFKDSDSHWAAENIGFVAARGMFGGTGEGNFSPNVGMSRGMLVTVLYNLEQGEYDKARQVFNDVPAGEWYSYGAAWAAKNDIVTGVGDNNFAPNANVSREQTAVILFKYAKMLGLDISGRASIGHFNDDHHLASWAEDAMKWAVDCGLITGKPGSLLDPKGNTTRAEMATIMRKFVEFSLG